MTGVQTCALPIYRLGRPRQAIQAFVQSLEVAPLAQRSTLWHLVGRNRLRLEEVREAEVAFEQAGDLRVSRSERVRIRVRPGRRRWPPPGKNPAPQAPNYTWENKGKQTKDNGAQSAPGIFTVPDEIQREYMKSPFLSISGNAVCKGTFRKEPYRIGFKLCP